LFTLSQPDINVCEFGLLVGELKEWFVFGLHNGLIGIISIINVQKTKFYHKLNCPKFINTYLHIES